jgi:hypothetical protein
MPTKVQLTGGSFQDSEGNLLALGYLKMKLNQDESITGVGQVCSGIEITINLDASGVVVASPAQSVWGNDQMSPINSYYRVTGFTAKGQPAWGPNNQQVNGSGGTFDVGTWVPNQVISWSPGLQMPTLQVNEVNNVLQSKLDLKNTATVTWVDDGNGSVEATASGGASTPAQSYLILGNLHGWLCNPDSVQFAGIGATLASAIGTYANFAPTATEGPAIQITSQAISQGQGTVYGNNVTGVALGPLKYWQTRTKIGSNGAGIVWYAGISNVNPGSTLMQSSPTTQTVLAFRWISGDANWSCVACDGGGTPTIVNSGVAVDTNFHLFQMFPTAGGTSVTFKIDGTTVATIATHLPGASTNLNSVVTIQANAVTNTVQFVWWSF